MWNTRCFKLFWFLLLARLYFAPDCGATTNDNREPTRECENVRPACNLKPRDGGSRKVLKLHATDIDQERARAKHSARLSSQCP